MGRVLLSLFLFLFPLSPLFALLLCSFVLSVGRLFGACPLICYFTCITAPFVRLSFSDVLLRAFLPGDLSLCLAPSTTTFAPYSLAPCPVIHTSSIALRPPSYLSSTSPDPSTGVFYRLFLYYLTSSTAPDNAHPLALGAHLCSYRANLDLGHHLRQPYDGYTHVCPHTTYATRSIQPSKTAQPNRQTVSVAVSSKSVPTHTSPTSVSHLADLCCSLLTAAAALSITSCGLSCPSPSALAPFAVLIHPRQIPHPFFFSKVRTPPPLPRSSS